MTSMIWSAVESRLGEYLDFRREDGQISLGLTSQKLKLQKVALKPEAIRRLLGIPFTFSGSVESVVVECVLSWTQHFQITVELSGVSISIRADSNAVARACAGELAEERTIEVRDKLLEAAEVRAALSSNRKRAGSAETNSTSQTEGQAAGGGGKVSNNATPAKVPDKAKNAKDGSDANDVSEEPKGAGWGPWLAYKVKDNLAVLLRNVEIRFAHDTAESQSASRIYICRLRELQLYNVDPLTGLKVPISRNLGAPRNTDGRAQKVVKKAKLGDLSLCCERRTLKLNRPNQKNAADMEGSHLDFDQLPQIGALGGLFGIISPLRSIDVVGGRAGEKFTVQQSYIIHPSSFEVLVEHNINTSDASYYISGVIDKVALRLEQQHVRDYGQVSWFLGRHFDRERVHMQRTQVFIPLKRLMVWEVQAGGGGAAVTVPSKARRRWQWAGICVLHQRGLSHGKGKLARLFRGKIAELEQMQRAKFLAFLSNQAQNLNQNLGSTSTKQSDRDGSGSPAISTGGAQSQSERSNTSSPSANQGRLELRADGQADAGSSTSTSQRTELQQLQLEVWNQSKLIGWKEEFVIATLKAKPGSQQNQNQDSSKQGGVRGWLRSKLWGGGGSGTGTASASASGSAAAAPSPSSAQETGSQQVSLSDGVSTSATSTSASGAHEDAEFQLDQISKLLEQQSEGSYSTQETTSSLASSSNTSSKPKGPGSGTVESDQNDSESALPTDAEATRRAHITCDLCLTGVELQLVHSTGSRFTGALSDLRIQFSNNGVSLATAERVAFERKKKEMESSTSNFSDSEAVLRLRQGIAADAQEILRMRNTSQTEVRKAMDKRGFTDAFGMVVLCELGDVFLSYESNDWVVLSLGATHHPDDVLNRDNKLNLVYRSQAMLSDGGSGQAKVSDPHKVPKSEKKRRRKKLKTGGAKRGEKEKFNAHYTTLDTATIDGSSGAIEGTSGHEESENFSDDDESFDEKSHSKSDRKSKTRSAAARASEAKNSKEKPEPYKDPDNSFNSSENREKKTTDSESDSESGSGSSGSDSALESYDAADEFKKSVKKTAWQSLYVPEERRKPMLVQKLKNSLLAVEYCAVAHANSTPRLSVVAENVVVDYQRRIFTQIGEFFRMEEFLNDGEVEGDLQNIEENFQSKEGRNNVNVNERSEGSTGSGNSGRKLKQSGPGSKPKAAFDPEKAKAEHKEVEEESRWRRLKKATSVIDIDVRVAAPTILLPTRFQYRPEHPYMAVNLGHFRMQNRGSILSMVDYFNCGLRNLAQSSSSDTNLSLREAATQFSSTEIVNAAKAQVAAASSSNTANATTNLSTNLKTVTSTGAVSAVGASAASASTSNPRAAELSQSHASANFTKTDLKSVLMLAAVEDTLLSAERFHITLTDVQVTCLKSALQIPDFIRQSQSPSLSPPKETNSQADSTSSACSSSTSTSTFKYMLKNVTLSLNLDLCVLDRIAPGETTKMGLTHVSGMLPDLSAYLDRFCYDTLLESLKLCLTTFARSGSKTKTSSAGGGGNAYAYQKETENENDMFVPANFTQTDEHVRAHLQTPDSMLVNITLQKAAIAVHDALTPARAKLSPCKVGKEDFLELVAKHVRVSVAVRQVLMKMDLKFRSVGITRPNAQVKRDRYVLSTFGPYDSEGAEGRGDGQGNDVTATEANLTGSDGEGGVTGNRKKGSGAAGRIWSESELEEFPNESECKYETTVPDFLRFSCPSGQKKRASSKQHDHLTVSMCGVHERGPRLPELFEFCDGAFWKIIWVVLF